VPPTKLFSYADRYLVPSLHFANRLYWLIRSVFRALQTLFPAGS
jgi:hypothetical protein